MQFGQQSLNLLVGMNLQMLLQKSKVPMVIVVAIGTIFYNIKCDCQKKEAIELGINLISSYPIVNANGKEVRLSNLRDTIRIVYRDQKILYEFFRKRVFETDEVVQNEHEYFVYNKDSLNGFLFHDPPDTVQMLRIDSMIKEKGMGGIKMQIGVNDSLVSELSERESVIVNKFVPKYNTPKYFDTTVFYFDKSLSDVSFSFSQKMDSLGKGKLFRVRLIQNEEINKDLKLLIPRREYYFEIQKMTHSDLIKYLKVLKSFYDQNRIHETN